MPFLKTPLCFRNSQFSNHVDLSEKSLQHCCVENSNWVLIRKNSEVNKYVHYLVT